MKITGRGDYSRFKRKKKSVNTRISFKEKRVELASQEKNFKLCDQLTEEIAELQKQRRMLESETRGLLKKEKKAKWYKAKKNKSMMSSPVSSDSETETADGDTTPKFIVTGGSTSSSSVETPPPRPKDDSRRMSLPPNSTNAYENERSKSTPPQSYSLSGDFECTESVFSHDSTIVLSDSSGGGAGGDRSGERSNQEEDDGLF